MKFICHQDLNKMPDVEGGKFCTQCSKKVYDFTNKLKSDVILANKENKELCGIYKAEHVDDDIIIGVADFFKNTTLKYVASASLLLSSGNLYSQSKKEVVIKEVVINSDTNKVCVKQKDSIQNNTNPSDYKKESKDKSKIKKNKHYRKKLYFTRKFPFIKLGRRYISGYIGWR